MTSEQDELVGRVRAALPQGRLIREVSMFGGRSFMVDDRMVAAAAFAVHRRVALTGTRC